MRLSRQEESRNRTGYNKRKRVLAVDKTGEEGKKEGFSRRDETERGKKK